MTGSDPTPAPILRPIIPLTPTHCIDRGALAVWFADHGIDARDVVTAGIRVDRERFDAAVSAWLDVEYYLRNGNGRRFVDETGENPATALSTVPLHSFPPLVPIPTKD